MSALHLYTVGMNNEAARAIQAKARLIDPTQVGNLASTLQPYGRGYRQTLGADCILWSLACGAHYMSNLLVDHWLRLGGAQGFLGFPVTDELATSKGNGRFCDFQGGSLYWSAVSGVAAVQGVIRDYWASLGGVASVLGFPLAEEMVGVGRLVVVQPFMGGLVVWSKQEEVVDHLIGSMV